MRSILLFTCIAAGILLPQAEKYNFLIQYLLMTMLFVSFLGIKVTRKIFTKDILLILLANIVLAFAWYLVLFPINHTLALIAFMTAIAPTANAAIPVTHLLRGKVEYVMASVIVTNLVIASLLPLFISILHVQAADTPVVKALQNITLVVIVPLLLAKLVSTYLPHVGKFISRYKAVSFYAWIVAVFLAVSTSSNFIHVHRNIPTKNLIGTALVVLGICLVNFSLGRLIGHKDHKLEASQSLGQKSTAFSVWYAVTFLSPIIALGPVFYLIFHNLYNSFQMIMKDREAKRLALAQSVENEAL